MDYYKLLKLKREPFSNSPDPVFFFKSRRHLECLQQLELSVRLRRGLNVVIGDVGTGKTTLCHQLIRQLDREEKFKSFLMLDPSFRNPRDFLRNAAAMFLGEIESDASDWELKEKIKHYLFTKGVNENKIVVLIIDEGQKTSYACLELLREFLNYETNQHKLLQIIIFAQDEFADTITDLPNLSDRINHCHVLGPLDFRDTKAMIQFRLMRASENNSTSTSLFSFPAMFAIYRATGGYPRKIINLCHKVTLALIIQDRSRAGWLLVRSCIHKALPRQSRKWHWATATVISCTAAVFLLLPFSPSPYKITMPWNWSEATQAFTSTDTLPPENGAIRVKIDKASLDAGKAPPVSIQNPSKKPAGEAIKASPVPTRESSSPKMLGKITVKEKTETVGDMIVAIYGSFEEGKYLDAVARANPHIPDLNIIEIGDEINFPAIPLKPIWPFHSRYWVKVDHYETLDRAYQFFKSYPNDAPPARIIPYWNRENGLAFAIVLKKYYNNKSLAHDAMISLNTTGGKCLTQWRNNTVFFAELPR